MPAVVGSKAGMSAKDLWPGKRPRGFGAWATVTGSNTGFFRLYKRSPARAALFKGERFPHVFQWVPTLPQGKKKAAGIPSRRPFGWLPVDRPSPRFAPVS